MPKLLRSTIVSVTLVMAMTAATAATASAGSWHTANTGNYAASSTAGFRLTFATGPVVFSCANSPTLAGTVNASAGAGDPWATFATGTIAVAGAGCVVAGVANYSITCASTSIATKTGVTAYVGGVGAPPASNGGKSDIVMTISCTVKQFGANCTTVAGTVDGSYTNPAAGAGDVLLAALGQSLTNGAAACGLPASSVVTMSNNTGASLLFTLTTPAVAANQPYLWWG